MTEVDSAPTSPSTLAQRLSAEVIGTFILVLIGCGAALGGGLKAGDAGFNGTVGLAFGLAVTISAYAFGRISGGHFNPAVSVGAAFDGRIAWVEAAFYAIAQILGAIIAAVVLWVVYHGFSGFKSTEVGLGANKYGDAAGNGFAWWACLIVEIVLTFIFVFIILAVTDDRNHYQMLAPLAIGLTLAIIHFVAIPLDGTSVNPARSIGPALFSGSDALKDLWVFIVAPLIGAAIAGLSYPLIFGRGADPVPGSGLKFGGGGGKSNAAFAQQWGQQGAPMQQQPIIQDGWQWDPATQQWIPAQQQAPVPPQAQDPAQGGGWQPPADSGGEHTMVRPPQ